MAANPGQVEQYRGGKPQVLGFFVGQVMKATGGRANPRVVNDLLRKRLESWRRGGNALWPRLPGRRRLWNNAVTCSREQSVSSIASRSSPTPDAS